MRQKLLKLFKENGDNSLFLELQKEYGGLVVYYAQKIHTKTKVYGEEMDDCIQQCWICFLKAVKNYDINSGHTFAAFLVSCLTNYMINHIRDYIRKRGKVNIISIDNYIIEDDNVSYLEMFESNYNSPAYDYELKEVLEKYKSLSLVSDLEKEIFFQHLKGYTYDELSNLYKIPRKKIDNIIRKVKGIIEGKNKIINP